MVLLHYPGHYYADIISTLSFLVAFAILIVGGIQLFRIIKDKRVDFTYQVYRDLFQYLNDPTNENIKEWLFEGKNYKEIPKDQYYKLGDLFEKFEAVNSLAKQNSLDEQTFYSLISFYVDMAASDKKTLTADMFIKSERESYKSKIPYSANLYDGFYKLRKRIADYEKKHHLIT